MFVRIRYCTPINPCPPEDEEETDNPTVWVHTAFVELIPKVLWCCPFCGLAWSVEEEEG